MSKIDQVDKLRCWKCGKFSPVQSFGGGFICYCRTCGTVLYNEDLPPREESDARRKLEGQR